MTPDTDARARRYLLGELGEDERAALEATYFQSGKALDAIGAAEEALIEDYLEGTLTAAERERFEHEYLASAQHRRRVETIRGLRIAAARHATPARPVRVSALDQSSNASRTPRWVRPLSLAALIVLGVAVTLWIVPRPIEAPVPGAAAPPLADSRPGGTAPEPPPPPPSPPPAPPAPRIVAMSLPPVAMRSGDDAPALVIPADADIVALSLEGAAVGAAPSRATIETVGGDPVWSGRARASASAGIVATLDVPASALPPDDYIVTLQGREAGAAREIDRFFLRVRAR